MTADPIGLAGGMNLYAYVSGDPVNLIDPMGLAGKTTHGLRKCLPTDDCATLLDKINKLISSLKERKEEMVPYTITGQSYQTWAGHAEQIRMQNIMLMNCTNYYQNHQPPCDDQCPEYDPYPIPHWTPPPESEPEAAGGVAAAILLFVYSIINN